MAIRQSVAEEVAGEGLVLKGLLQEGFYFEGHCFNAEANHADDVLAWCYCSSSSRKMLGLRSIPILDITSDDEEDEEMEKVGSDDEEGEKVNVLGSGSSGCGKGDDDDEDESDWGEIVSRLCEDSVTTQKF